MHSLMDGVETPMLTVEQVVFQDAPLHQLL